MLRIKPDNLCADQNYSKVEDASDRATDAAFGLVDSTTMSAGRKKGRALAQTHTRLARFEEEAHSEAQELLQQWVTDKVHFDADDGYDDLEAWRRARKHAQNGPGNNNYVPDRSDEEEPETAAAILNKIKLDDGDNEEDDWSVDETAIYERVKRLALGQEDPYAHLYDMDENEAVSSVLKTLMSKDVVKEAFKKDLGFGDNTKSVPDPRTKMELRHQMVKENREKRQKEEVKKMKVMQMKKEAKVKAQQMINKEQKDKESQVRKEEEEIKKEMMRLRKEMALENRKKEDKGRRDREEREMLERLAREELEREKFEEERMQLEWRRNESERRKNAMIKHEMWQTKQEAKSLKCLHLHFNAWYDHVLSRRLLLGKVKAMSDWKVMVRVWSAWKAYVRGQRAQVASVQHEKEVIESHRKTLTSQTHYQHRLLRRCLDGWRYFVKHEVEMREMEEEKSRTKNKMLSLLNAVAEGRLTHDPSGDLDTERSRASSRQASTVNSSSNNNRHPGQKGLNPNHRVQAWVDDSDSISDVDSQSCTSDFTRVTRDNPETSRRPNSAASWQRSKVKPRRPSSGMSDSTSATASTTGKGRKPIPTQAWQANKQRTQLPLEDTRTLGQGHADEDDEDDPDGDGFHGDDVPQNFTDAQIRKRFGNQPWMNRPPVVNNMEHRYHAQQKALRQQQEEIREQKRLIQDLQHAQQRQQLATGVVSPQPASSSSSRVLAPPKGNEIPRDVDDISDTSARTGSGGGCSGGGSGSGHVVIHSGNSQTTLTKAKPSTVFGMAGGDEPLDGHGTDRSGVTTSDVSKVSSTGTHNNKYLQVLKTMEERSAHRARLKADREEKKRIQEEEKLAELEKLEAERMREIEEEKKARVEAYRLKKRLEKQKEEERHREASRQQEFLDRAKAHYQRSILKYRGLLPLKKLISLSKRNWNKAVKHHNKMILRQSLRDWRSFSLQEVDRKNKMADQMGEFLTVKHCFDRWRKHKYHTEYLLCRADRHHQSTLRSKVFYAWLEWKGLEKVESERRMEEARAYYWDHLLRSRFLAWKFLPEKQKREEERKKRKMEMRARVAQLIPDFAPRQSMENGGLGDGSHDFG